MSHSHRNTGTLPNSTANGRCQLRRSICHSPAWHCPLPSRSSGPAACMYPPAPQRGLRAGAAPPLLLQPRLVLPGAQQSTRCLRCSVTNFTMVLHKEKEDQHLGMEQISVAVEHEGILSPANSSPPRELPAPCTESAWGQRAESPSPPSGPTPHKVH